MCVSDFVCVDVDGLMFVRTSQSQFRCVCVIYNSGLARSMVVWGLCWGFVGDLGSCQISSVLPLSVFSVRRLNSIDVKYQMWKLGVVFTDNVSL